MATTVKPLTHLQSPGDTERGHNVGASKQGRRILPQKGATSSPLQRQSNLGLVERDTRRSGTNRPSTNVSSGNGDSAVLRGTLKDGAENPNRSRNIVEPPSQKACQPGDQESSEEEDFIGEFDSRQPNVL